MTKNRCNQHVAKSICATAFISIALAANVFGSPLVPTIRLTPDDFVTVEVDITANSEGEIVPGRMTVARVFVSESEAYDFGVSITLPEPGDASLPRVNLTPGEVAGLSFSMKLQSPDAPAPRFAKEVTTTCLSSGTDPAAATIELAADQCSHQNRSLHIICGDVAFICSWEPLPIDVQQLPDKPLVPSFGSLSMGESFDSEAIMSTFGAVSIATSVEQTSREGAETCNAPITPTVKALNSNEDPELSPLVPTIRITSDTGTSFLATIWGSVY